MIAEGIQKIIDITTAEILGFDGDGGKKFATNHIYPIKEPEVICICINSLQGLVDYIKIEDRKDLFFHIISPEKVEIKSKIFGPWKQRETFITSDVIKIDYKIDNCSIENAIVKLQSCYEPTKDQERLLSILGNIDDSIITNYSDDGISQEVKVKAGITRVDKAKFPNPVILAPYRTFAEVSQPESKYIIRLSKLNGEIAVILKEADGGAWRILAHEKIKTWLANENTGLPIIG